jgi:hypothetical protein
MTPEINLSLRTDILEMALLLENEINTLLTSCLNIENQNAKAISNKNSSLSFKNKIDLLFDIEMFSKEEHSQLLLLMEFRNQFLHNITCSSFSKAIELLGNDRAKHLSKFDNIDFDADQEFKYLNSYKGLFVHCLGLIVGIYEKRENEANSRRKALANTIDYSNSITKNDSETLLQIIKKCIPNKEDSQELIGFKLSIVSFIDLQSKIIMSDIEKYKGLKTELETLMQDKNFKKLLIG